MTLTKGCCERCNIPEHKDEKSWWPQQCKGVVPCPCHQRECNCTETRQFDHAGWCRHTPQQEEVPDHVLEAAQEAFGRKPLDASWEEQISQELSGQLEGKLEPWAIDLKNVFTIVRKVRDEGYDAGRKEGFIVGKVEGREIGRRRAVEEFRKGGGDDIIK